MTIHESNNTHEINNTHETNNIYAVNNKVLDEKGPNNEEPVPISDPAVLEPDNMKDSYEGRKHEPEIDGPQQKSQETDEIYSDPRKEENLPDGGKNVADLNAYDLSQKGNEI